MSIPRGWAALVGIVSAGVTLAVAELVSVMVGPGGSPMVAVGAWVIDLVPPFVKDTVIALFGTADKIVLIGVLALLVAGLAALAGLAQYRRPPLGVVLLAVVSGIGALATVTRPDSSGGDALPSVIGMLAGAAVLMIATVRLKAWRDVAAPADEGGPAAASAAPSRRAFLRMVGITGAAAVVVGLGSRMFTGATAAVTAVRASLKLPSPAVVAPPVPAAASLDVPGLSPVITPNADFYRIDIALQVPSVDPADWSLRIHGMVDEEVVITWAELLALPLEEHAVTLSCVSNEVGGDLIGTAMWLGYPLRELLKRAQPQAGADMVLSRSIDGFTASSPLAVLQEENRASLLAVGMNGELLPLEHGFPVRMVVPGLYGYVSATKWVTELEVTTFDAEKAYWSTRGWSERGPIKTESRIDVPRVGQGVTAGTVAVAGVAWAPHTGVAKVEVQIDGGPWQEARLAQAVSADTWVQWVFEWDAAAGSHEIAVRATDASGYTQTADEAAPAPDGATGWHRRTISVS